MRRLSFILAFTAVFPVQSEPVSFEQRIPSPDTGRGITGRASFSGEVLMPACTLMMDNNWQEIDVSQATFNKKVEHILVQEKPVLLQLVNCDFFGKEAFHTANWIYFSFDGTPGKHPDRFMLSGMTNGMDLQIQDQNGRFVFVNTIMPKILVDATDRGLAYTLRLVRDDKLSEVGDYYGSLRFRVSYE